MWNQEKTIDMLQDYIDKEIFPGCNFAVLQGSQVEEFVFGAAQIIPQVEPLKAGKVWDLASVTKVVGTGTAMIDLILSGKIDVDSSVKTYLPEFSHENLTIRQLITHTSGIEPFIKNRDQMNADQLKQAILNISVSADKSFHYTDINFILLGFLLENYYKKDLAQIFQEKIFQPWQMTKTSFGPVENAVPTAQNVPVGTVHDPKARVLGVHCGSAGLFSDLLSLEHFVQGYFADDKYLQLLQNFATGKKQRSLAWDILENHENWLSHTGYTGTFILMNLPLKRAVIFLSNRVHLKDERAQWIKDRDKLIDRFIAGFDNEI